MPPHYRYTECLRSGQRTLAPLVIAMYVADERRNTGGDTTTMQVYEKIRWFQQLFGQKVGDFLGDRAVLITWKNPG